MNGNTGRPQLAKHGIINGVRSVIGCLLLTSSLCQAQNTLAGGTSQSQVAQGRSPETAGPPQWPKPAEAPAGAPNVLVIMTDDVGFGASSAFGGLIPTPTFDALAARGLRYNRFNTTALCSPTRAALLTGREPHTVGIGNVTNIATGYPGYTSVLSDQAGTVAQTLQQNGYSTAALGKWHLVPEWEQTPVGPFDRWPSHKGFDYYYGFLSGDTNQFAPSLYENLNAVLPPAHDPSYILDRDLSDHAINWLTQQHDIAPQRPFFLYVAPGTAHAPHHAPQDWLLKFRGRFDQGWDVVREQIFAQQKRLGVIPADAKLTPRPSSLPAWSSLTPDQKRLYARYMEAYAAALSFSDDQIGRVIKHLDETGQLHNTLIFFVQGDNGSSAEGSPTGVLAEQSFMNGYGDDLSYALKHIDDIGGPKAYNHFPSAWAWAMDTPFQYYKQVASHLGGIRNGLVVSWDGHIKDPGAVRSQYLYITDIVPTILEATGVKQPAEMNGIAQMPLEGASFADSLTNPQSPEHHPHQVFEMFQNLGIYDHGWWAGTTPFAAPWTSTMAQKMDIDKRNWELYNIDADYSQSNDLAAKYPAKLKEMKDMFWADAARNQILPIHGLDGSDGKPSYSAYRSRLVYHPGLTRLHENSAPRLIGRSYQIKADLDLPQTAANGVIVAQGGRFGGYSLYLQRGVPIFYYNAIGDHQYRVAATNPLSPGKHVLTADFAADSPKPGTGGTMTLSVDGQPVANGRIERTHRVWISITEGFDVGEDTLTPVSEDYQVDTSKFTGTIEDVTFNIK